MSASSEPVAVSKKASKESGSSSSAAPAAQKAAAVVDKADAKTPLFPVTPDWKKVPLHERIVVDAACKLLKERERKREKKKQKNNNFC